MRRVLGLLAAIGVLAATFPATVAAAPPGRLSVTQTGVLCQLPSDAGFLSLYVDVNDSYTFADLVLWGPDADPYSDLPTIVTSVGQARLDGSSLSGSFELVLEADPEKLAGSARLAAELTPAGPAEDFGSRDLHDGNRRYRIEQTLQLLTVSGTLTLHMFNGTYDEVDLAPCLANVVASSYFSTNPNAYLTTTQQVFISCHWATELGVVDLLAIADDYTNLSLVTIVGDDRALVGLATPSLTATEYQASSELFDPASGHGTVGTAVAGASLSPSGERITELEWLDPYRFNVVGQGLTADGSLSLSVDGTSLVLPMDGTSCDGGDVLVQVMERMPRG